MRNNVQAVEQIRLAEEVKVTKEKIKEVEEEWQSNLLNWKSKRRQSKEGGNSKNGSEDGDDNGDAPASRKIKTFSEILNEKAKSGHRLGYNLSRYVEGEEESVELFNEQTNGSSHNHRSATAGSENSIDSESKINYFSFLLPAATPADCLPLILSIRAANACICASLCVCVCYFSFGHDDLLSRAVPGLLALGGLRRVIYRAVVDLVRFSRAAHMQQ